MIPLEPATIRGLFSSEYEPVLTVSPRAWGRTWAPDLQLDWTLDGDAWVSERGARVASAPFLGVIGMPPPEPGEHSTTPPRRWGGNVDCKELVAGTTLYLPIPVDGALVLAGDGHGAQGDGEVSGRRSSISWSASWDSSASTRSRSRASPSISA